MKRLWVLSLALLVNLWGGAITVGGAEVSVPRGSDNTPLILEANLSANGSTLLSIPLDTGSTDVNQWLVNMGLSSMGIHGWSAQTQKYVPLKTLRPGEGFLVARGPGKVSIQGQRIVAPSVEVPLAKGWNLIGVPYESGIPLFSLRINLSGETKNYNLAAEVKWVGGVNTLIDGQMIPVAHSDSTVLESWRGYWFYAYQPCTLQIPSAQPDKKARSNKHKR